MGVNYQDQGDFSMPEIIVNDRVECRLGISGFHIVVYNSIPPFFLIEKELDKITHWRPLTVKYHRMRRKFIKLLFR